jgi:hypothetical protein
MIVVTRRSNITNIPSFAGWFVRSFVVCARNSPACDLGTGEVVQPQLKDPRLHNVVATDPAGDDQPHPVDSEHLVPPFFAHWAGSARMKSARGP